MPSKPNILLVDDQEENLVALEALLRLRDAELLRTRSGAEALEALLTHDVALALVDVQMPELDGIELAELMRGTARTREIPIIFVTAGIHDQARIFRGYEAGAVDFLYKPLDPVVLRSKVDVFLQLHRQRQALADQLAALRTAERALREADARKDEFLGILSHELRNPLGPIRNAVYILARAPDGSEQAHHARAVIERQTSQLARLVDDLLDVTRISRGKIQLQKRRVELGVLLRQVVEDHRSLFSSRDIGLSLTSEGGPYWVEVDAARIAQAIGNLLGNAAKFTNARGQVVVRVRKDSASHATVEVVDDGVGIAAEMLGKVFEPFVQEEHSLHRGAGGLGLGLALVKGLVEMHDGHVEARSRGPGHGAEFGISLPLLPEAAAPTAVSPAAAGTAGVLRLLVIEDNLDAAETLKEALEMSGHEVSLAHDGPTGLAKACAIKPDVVLCDIGLPLMDGFEVARQIRAEPSISPTLIALTGYARPEDQRKAFRAGFDHHMSKPVNLPHLLQVLSSAATHPTSRRILVVEDNDVLRANIRELLEQEDWEVREARTGNEAVEVAKQFEPAVILLDYHLPEMDGGEVARRLGAVLAVPRVVLMTASSQVRELASLNGLRFYVPKPFSGDDLLDTVEHARSGS